MPNSAKAVILYLSIIPQRAPINHVVVLRYVLFFAHPTLKMYPFCTLLCYINHVYTQGSALIYLTLSHHLRIIDDLSNNRSCITMGYDIFLPDLPWVSPWIKSISNTLDIIIHMIASQLSGHCDVIDNRLWRHQNIENRASETLRRCGKFVASIINYGFVMSCKK